MQLLSDIPLRRTVVDLEYPIYIQRHRDRSLPTVSTVKSVKPVPNLTNSLRPCARQQQQQHHLRTLPNTLVGINDTASRLGLPSRRGH